MIKRQEVECQKLGNSQEKPEGHLKDKKKGKSSGRRVLKKDTLKNEI